MRVASELRKLAKKIEDESNDVLDVISNNSELTEDVIKIIAYNSFNLEKLAAYAEKIENLSVLDDDKLEELAILASEFDASNDPSLQKQASVIDEILLTIAAPKNAAVEAIKKNEDEINKLRAEYRSKTIDKLYSDPKKALDKGNMAEEQAKAVNETVKRYKPLEAPLQTRYSPDIPGEQLARIGDHVYQSLLTGKIYDYKSGYVTDKGNQIPGSSVEMQTPDLGGNQASRAIFDTRENVTSRYASNLDSVLKIIKK